MEDKKMKKAKNERVQTTEVLVKKEGRNGETVGIKTRIEYLYE